MATKCKSCGSKNVRKDTMSENGEPMEITICNEKDCRWWGE